MFSAISDQPLGREASSQSREAGIAQAREKEASLLRAACSRRWPVKPDSDCGGATVETYQPQMEGVGVLRGQADAASQSVPKGQSKERRPAGAPPEQATPRPLPQETRSDPELGSNKALEEEV